MRALPIVFLIVAGCAGSLGGWSHATGEQLTRRASFDLDCASSNLRYNRIDAQTQGVVGCGKHATYVESCARTSASTDPVCTWMLNGVVGTSAAPAASAASAAPGAPSAPN
jgi:hypothetical protein